MPGDIPDHNDHHSLHPYVWLFAKEKEAVEEALNVVREAGGKINYPDKKAFQDKVKPMYELYNGTSIYDLISDISEIE